jgi:hypothetical protein
MNKDLNINLSKDSIASTFKGFVLKLRSYSVTIFAIFVLASYGFLVYQISALSNIKPNEEQVLEQQQVIKRPQIDEETVRKIEQLEDQNIAVQSLFKAARDNPFQD